MIARTGPIRLDAVANSEDDEAGAVEAPEGAVDFSDEVRVFHGNGWPSGYLYGATRYADVILRESFPERFEDLIAVLASYYPPMDEIRRGGGGRTPFVRWFDEALHARTEGGEMVWGKQNITIAKELGLDGSVIRSTKTRGHEIDMFGKGTLEVPLPGIAVEMEWNNKDPFFDRDLNNFQALHREGAIAVGVIVTRGAELQDLLLSTVRSAQGGAKFGQSTTHWRKLIPKVNLGGGGECPLLLIGIEPARITGVELAEKVAERLSDARSHRDTWRERGVSADDAQAEYQDACDKARALMPGLSKP